MYKKGKEINETSKKMHGNIQKTYVLYTSKKYNEVYFKNDTRQFATNRVNI